MPYITWGTVGGATENPRHYVEQAIGEHAGSFDVAALTAAFRGELQDALPAGWLLEADDIYCPRGAEDPEATAREALESVDFTALLAATDLAA
ncbi:hypothetical protein [Streptomyces lonarensis]|uniref:Uncharacterized protein n=1 Tax=Streptomyces lonarensis TaxID=700599 RepID=A0A7X6HX96_9ACTN|nr:hypothetical protein [Streptomyces lonarensis]NJQ04306.1 hypothetical protein [Streptomyces lonarensis]